MKNIKNLIGFMILTLIFFSCAHRGLKLPEASAPDTNHSEVNIIREGGFLGFGFSLTVMLDDKVLCGLRTGEYVRFNVKSGIHTLGLSRSTISVPLLPEGKYYFLIKTYTDQFGFEFERIDDKMGSHLITISNIIE